MSTTTTGSVIRHMEAMKSCSTSVRCSAVAELLIQNGPCPLNVPIMAMIVVRAIPTMTPPKPCRKAASISTGYSRNSSGCCVCENTTVDVAAISIRISTYSPRRPLRPSRRDPSDRPTTVSVAKTTMPSTCEVSHVATVYQKSACTVSSSVTPETSAETMQATIVLAMATVPVSAMRSWSVAGPAKRTTHAATNHASNVPAIANDSDENSHKSRCTRTARFAANATKMYTGQRDLREVMSNPHSRPLGIHIVETPAAARVKVSDSQHDTATASPRTTLLRRTMATSLLLAIDFMRNCRRGGRLQV